MRRSALLLELLEWRRRSIRAAALFKLAMLSLARQKSRMVPSIAWQVWLQSFGALSLAGVRESVIGFLMKDSTGRS